MPAILLVAAMVAGGVAAVAGFGIGSILTPLLALETGTRLAVAAVSIPHLLATGLRFWLMRQHVDRWVLIRFGVLSAAGGLLGAVLHSYSTNTALTVVFAGLLLFAGLVQLTDASSHLRFPGGIAWVAGLLSGVLGGLVGNQGGIRSAALLHFDLTRQAFVATATGIALMVDLARMPYYLATQFAEIASIWPAIVVMSMGAVAGTLGGSTVLGKLPEPVFRRIVAALLIALGLSMLSREFVWSGG